MKAKWTKIEDSKVQMFWKCPECQEEVIIPPSFYEESGTPICPNPKSNCEGTDMAYVRTEILK